MGGTHLWSLCVSGEPSQSCRHLYEQPRHILKVPFSVCTLSTNNLPFLFCFHKEKRQLEIETAIFSTLTPGGHPVPSPTPTSLGDTNVPLETSAQETFVRMASVVLYTKWWQILPVSFHFVPTSHLLQGLYPVPTSGTVHILQTTSLTESLFLLLYIIPQSIFLNSESCPLESGLKPSSWFLTTSLLSTKKLCRGWGHTDTTSFLAPLPGIFRRMPLGWNI